MKAAMTVAMMVGMMMMEMSSGPYLVERKAFQTRKD